MASFIKRGPTLADMRRARPNSFYHVYSHAVQGLRPFRTEQAKLSLLDAVSRRLPGGFITPSGPQVFDDIIVLAYALMDNHLHLLLGQGSDQTSIGRFTANVLRAFALQYNSATEHTGQVFLKPYSARFLPARGDVMTEIAYIHRNPKRDDLIVANTSHARYAGLAPAGFVDVERGLELFGGREKYLDFFAAYSHFRVERS